MTINKMLIDAAHPEETRVAVLRGDRIEEFDYESANKKLLRGNIYLAKVTRVEPSLQAAFVEYGGNRHGFLAFSDIHPDYYQIPFADRQALLAAEAEAAAEEDEEDDDLPLERPHVEDASDDHDDAPGDPFDLGDEDEAPAPGPTWLGALGQMVAALLAVVALVALFIGAAAVVRRLLP